ncbi:ATP synthase delta chain [Gracilibacillus boraciitolerans JCM 21714]|uniref:ATP synthase subunit delta n=1 Tax=Gracilibacillus boraciitolerans JCM 21714 TaxID=1298598 RepID=W4VH23_9BACI|nr:F0F1 ATP synthase subunit delta [Gracilibacillus boraciitolerans]GAE92502.1 ATP synthase delta chain [Gracilibacillus boraciitolerans JCM 21714]
MSNTNVAKRYAEALFQIAVEKETIDFLETELTTVKEVFQTNQEILPFLQHPKVNVKEKKQLLNEAFAGFSKDVLHTLSLLVDRHNEEIIPDVVDHFISFANEANGIKQATVFSVRALTDAEKEEISQVFTKKLNVKELKIDNQIDPEIIGGVKIKVDNTIYDGSVKGKLDRLERQIVTVN